MEPSPLHLEGYHVAEFFFKLNEAFEKKTVFGSSSGYHYRMEKAWNIEPTDFTVNGEVGRHTEDPSRLRYVLTIASAGRKDRYPYSFRLSLVGYFHFHAGEPDTNEFILVYANAPSVLYGAAREMLATMTGRGPYPAVILPTASFLDHAKAAAEGVLEEIKSLRSKRKQLAAAKPTKTVKPVKPVKRARAVKK